MLKFELKLRRKRGCSGLESAYKRVDESQAEETQSQVGNVKIGWTPQPRMQPNNIRSIFTHKAFVISGVC